MDFQSVIKSVSLTNPSWDLFVLVTFAVVICAYLFRFGKDRAFLILISTYISFALIEKLPLIEKVAGVSLKNTPTDKALIFLAGIFAVYFILSRSAFTSVSRIVSKKSWFPTLVLSFLQVGLIISLIISFLSPAEVKDLSAFLRYFFATDSAQFFWLVAPFAAIFLLKEK